MLKSIDPDMMAQKVQGNDLVQFKLKMDGLKNRLSGQKDQEAELKEVCKNFEAIFVGKLWKQMRDSIPKDGLLHSKMEDQYMSMFDKEFSEHLADAGGIGMADMLYDQLSRTLQNTSKTTLSGQVNPAASMPLDQAKRGFMPKGGLDNTEDPGPAPFSYTEEADPVGPSSEAPASAMDQVEALARRIEREHENAAPPAVSTVTAAASKGLDTYRKNGIALARNDFGNDIAE